MIDVAMVVCALCGGTSQDKVRCMFSALGHKPSARVSRDDMRHFMRQLVALLSASPVRAVLLVRLTCVGWMCNVTNRFGVCRVLCWFSASRVR